MLHWSRVRELCVINLKGKGKREKGKNKKRKHKKQHSKS
jgi:hypothetical protein